MYFKNFPTLLYPFYINGQVVGKVVKDITLNVRVIKSVLANITLYDEYLMQDGDTPEIIAEKMYKDPNLHWTIMLVNDRYDYINDFPVPDSILEQVVLEKYGAGNRNAIHNLYGRLHYEDAFGNIVDSSAAFAVPVTNYDYESRLNEEKRSIKLISPDLIHVFVTDIQEAFVTNVR